MMKTEQAEPLARRCHGQYAICISARANIEYTDWVNAKLLSRANNQRALAPLASLSIPLASSCFVASAHRLSAVASQGVCRQKPLAQPMDYAEVFPFFRTYATGRAAARHALPPGACRRATDTRMSRFPRSPTGPHNVRAELVRRALAAFSRHATPGIHRFSTVWGTSRTRNGQQATGALDVTS